MGMSLKDFVEAWKEKRQEFVDKKALSKAKQDVVVANEAAAKAQDELKRIRAEIQLLEDNL